MKPYITLEEALERRGEGRAYKLLTADNGCLSGCSSGITECTNYEYSDRPGAHEDQEGFYVLEGEGFVKLDDLEFQVKAGDSFIALPGVKHTMKSIEGKPILKVFWFHSAVK